MAVFVAILVMTIAYGALVAPASAQQSGILWSPYPTEYGATVGGAVTVEAGQILTYTLTGTDGDTRKYVVDGNVEGEQVYRDIMDFSLVQCESCPGWREYYISGATGLDTIWTFNGQPPMRLEQTEVKHDVWEADDRAEVWPGDEGTRNDGPPLGPFTKCVVITPNCGWIVGSVTVSGSGQPARGANVELYKDGTLVDSTNTDEGGNYEFRFVLAGDYQLKVTYGYGQQTKDAAVNKGECTTVNFEVDPGYPGPGW